MSVQILQLEMADLSKLQDIIGKLNVIGLSQRLKLCVLSFSSERASFHQSDNAG